MGENSIDKIEADSEIHSIQIQHLNREMYYEHNKVIGGMKIESILVDENYFHLLGVIRYVIFASKEGATPKLWKAFTSLPASVTYKV